MSIHVSTFDRWGDAEFPLAVMEAPFGGVMQEHTHDFYELVYVRRGGGIHHIAGRPYPMLAGDFYIMRPHDVHRYEADESAGTIINLLFQPGLFDDDTWSDLRRLPGLAECLNPTGDTPHKIALTPIDADAVDRCCDRLLAEFDHRGPGWKVAARSHFSNLLVRVSRAWATYGGTSAHEQLPTGPIADAISWLHHHFDEEISVSEIADSVGLTSNWFGERFRQQVGLTVHGYVAKLRIDHARILLDTTDRSITDIAMSVGYDDPSYFARVFKKATGITPRHYRMLKDPSLVAS